MFSLTRNNYYLKLGCILIFLSFFASCNNIEQDLPSAPETASKLLNKKDISSTHKDKGDSTQPITPQPDAFWAAPGSLWYVDNWRFDHYEPKAGKTVGVWPYDNSAGNLTTLRTKWGYSGIFIGADQTQYDNAVTAGYTINTMMIGVTGVPDANRYSIISNFGNAFAYYVDEPADQNHSMGGVRDALNSLNFNSLFVISGYKRTDALNSCVDAADKVMFSSYKHWYELLPGVWVSWPENDDQRPDWSDMQNRYGSKFSMTWICTKEVTEFDDLFGHAHNLGLTGVWIYAYKNQDGTPVAHYNDEFANISAAAYAHGFLRRFVRKWYNVYECYCADGCYGFPLSDDCWKYVRSEPTNEIVEQ